jgi:hypothetical protein
MDAACLKDKRVDEIMNGRFHFLRSDPVKAKKEGHRIAPGPF